MSAPGFQSRAFDVQDALYAVVSGVVSEPWEVSFGLPIRRLDEHVWIDERLDKWEREAWTTDGGYVETFASHVYCYVRRVGADARTLRDDLRTVADAIATGIAADVTLGGIVERASITGAEYDSSFADERATTREAVLRLDVEVASGLL